METETADTNNCRTPYKLRTRTARSLNEEVLSKIQADVSWNSDNDETKDSQLSSSPSESESLVDSDSDEPETGTREILQNSSQSKSILQKCTKCSRQFKDLKSFRKHKSNCTPTACGKCDKVLTTRDGLKKHIKIMHNPQNFKPISQTCTKCSLRFQDKKSFDRHYCEGPETKTPPSHKQFSTVVIKTGPEPARKPKTFECDQCDRAFARQDTLDSHLNSHTGKTLKCSICDKLFKQKNSLESHFLRKHQSPKIHKCHYCPEVFQNTRGLGLHERRKHTGIMPFGCPICPKRFVDPSEVRYHVMFHTGEKPHKCLEPGCDKAYTRSAHLKQHMTLHTGKRSFSCRVCNKNFRLSSHWRRHEIEVHKLLQAPQGGSTGSHCKNIGITKRDGTSGTTSSSVTKKTQGHSKAVNETSLRLSSKSRPNPRSRRISTTSKPEISAAGAGDPSPVDVDVEVNQDVKTEPTTTTIATFIPEEIISSNIYCPYCYISLQNEYELEEHGREFHAVRTSNPKELYSCPHVYCTENFVSVKELKNHQATVHNIKNV